MLTVIEDIEHPLAKGSLTTDGIQWSAEKTTGSDGYETVEEVTVSPPALGAVIELEFGLTCAVKSTGSAEGVLFKWQARNKGGPSQGEGWVDLHAEVTYAPNASAYREYTMSGRFKPIAGFNAVPFDLRLVIKSAAAGGENAVGKTKNASYVRVVYAAS